MVIRHGGLKDRKLTAVGGRTLFREAGPSGEDEVETQIRCTLGQLETELVDLVKQLLAPVFVLFDFFELSDDIYEEIVNGFVAGRVS